MKNREIDTSKMDVEFRQDYLNLTHTAAISSEGVIFKIGDKVGHEGANGEYGIITAFTIDMATIDVIAHTSKGIGRISFMFHP